jgi:dipeptidyl aminopeptidase/acylaminoacyl peptidase
MLIKLKPLFVVQGANDVRVTIKEADQIVAALRAKKILCSLHGEIR